VGELTAPAGALPPIVVKQRNLILATLLAFAAVGWFVFLGQANDHHHMARMGGAVEATSGEDMSGMGAMDETRPDAMAGGDMGEMVMARDATPDLTMGDNWPLFLGTWMAMMIAMMFPAATPMVLMYARMRRRDPVSTALFVGSYIALWCAFGVLANAISAAVEAGVEESAWIADNWGRVGGALLVLAAVYQLTPLKDVCPSCCPPSPSARVAMPRWGPKMAMTLTASTRARAAKLARSPRDGVRLASYPMCAQCVAQSTPMVAAGLVVLRRRSMMSFLKASFARPLAFVRRA
jgi:predicted metal-binding membrane protein